MGENATEADGSAERHRPGDFRQKSAGEIGKGHPQHFSEKFHFCMKERRIQMNMDPGAFR